MWEPTWINGWRAGMRIVEMSTGELLGKPDRMMGVTYDGQASHPEGVAILLGLYHNVQHTPPGLIIFISEVI